MHWQLFPLLGLVAALQVCRPCFPLNLLFFIIKINTSYNPFAGPEPVLSALPGGPVPGRLPGRQRRGMPPLHQGVHAHAVPKHYRRDVPQLLAGAEGDHLSGGPWRGRHLRRLPLLRLLRLRLPAARRAAARAARHRHQRQLLLHREHHLQRHPVLRLHAHHLPVRGPDSPLRHRQLARVAGAAAGRLLLRLPAVGLQRHHRAGALERPRRLAGARVGRR